MMPPLVHGVVDSSLVLLGRAADPAMYAGDGGAAGWPGAAAPAPHPVAALIVLLVVVIAVNGWRLWRSRRPAPGWPEEAGPDLAGPGGCQRL